MKNTTFSGRTTAKRYLPDEGMRRQFVYMAVGVALGFLLPRATVYGDLAPFGIGLAAAVSGPGTVLMYLATLAGYLMQGLTDSLRYLAALITVAGIRWSVSGFTSITKSRLFPSVTAFLGTVITGSALLLTASPSALSVLLILSEGLLAGGFAFFAVTVYKESVIEREITFTREAEVSVVVIAAVAMMALFTVDFGGIAPARIVSVLLILLAARSGKWAGGSVVGILLGTALLLSTPSHSYLAPAFALSGLLAGLFSEKSKWVTAMMPLIAVGIVTVVVGDEAAVVFALYETAAACVLFLLLPPIAESAVERLFRATHRLPEVYSARRAAALKMDHAARAMQEVAGTLDTVSAQLAGLGAPEPGSIYHTVSEEVCRTCRSKMDCWKKQYADTMDDFNHLTPLLNERGEITEEDFSERLKQRCRRLREISARINAAHREYRVRESAFRRLTELRRVITDQFSATAQLLEEFSDTLSRPEWTDSETASRIEAALKKQGVRVKQTVCRINERGRMEIELLLDGKYQTQNRNVFSSRIGELCGRSFSLPIVEYADRVTRIAFTERHAFRVTVGTAQLRSDGEALCGDAFECFQDGTGRQLAVLSDGMGNGGRAAVDGAMAAGLAARLLKAGFGYESLLKLVNTALMAKSEDESLATLDIAVINLFTGDMELLKAGAGVSLLYSNGRVSRLDDSSLPLGILRELTFARTADRLVDGDVLVLMSDGVSNDGVDWVEDLLRDYDRDTGGMQGLAQLIVDMARDRQTDEKGDDVTVITLGIHRLK
ncbi:MAG: SpoIIE family protein phosphatase [Clostridia bacterium]|nr:SpoIIE family protein phosphatase [Clostridia bacterium]